MTRLFNPSFRFGANPHRSHRLPRLVVGAAVVLALPLWNAAAARGGTIDAVVKEQAAANKAAIGTQARIDRLEEQTSDAALKYSDALALATGLETYGEQLETQIESQQDRLGDIKKQIDEIEVTQRNIIPLIEQMITTLEKFVSLDLPFNLEERQNRVATLQQVLGRSDVSTSEKYRRTLEAYQIEIEYGRSLDSYVGTLGEGDSARTVQFLRLGRIALVYQTADGEETGYWDAGRKQWIVDDQYKQDVRRAIAVAKKEGAPDLVVLPIPSQEEGTK